MVPLIYRDGHDNFILMHNGTSGYNNNNNNDTISNGVMVVWCVP